MKPQEYATYADAANDLVSLIVEFDSLMKIISQNQSEEKEVKYDPETKQVIKPESSGEFNEINLNEASLFHGESKQTHLDEASLFHGEFKQINLDEAVISSFASDLQDQSALYTTEKNAPDVAKVVYTQTLTANKDKLTEIINLFFNANSLQFNEYMDIITRACAHFCVIEKGDAAGDLLIRKLVTPKNDVKTTLSTMLVDYGANLNMSIVTTLKDEEGKAVVPEQKFRASTLFTSLYYKHDKNLILTMLENGAKEDSHLNAIMHALANGEIELTSVLLEKYGNGLMQNLHHDSIDLLEAHGETIYTNLHRYFHDITKSKDLFPYYLIDGTPVMIEEKVPHLTFLKALAILEKKGIAHSVQYTDKDKEILKSDLKEKIGDIKSSDDSHAQKINQLLEIYDSNIHSTHLNYKRRIGSRLLNNYTPIQTYSESRKEILRTIQTEVFALVINAWNYNSENLPAILKKVMAHDAFSKMHCGYNENIAIHQALIDMNNGNSSIIYKKTKAEPASSTISVTFPNFENHVMHPANRVHFNFDEKTENSTLPASSSVQASSSSSTSSSSTSYLSSIGSYFWRTKPKPVPKPVAMPTDEQVVEMKDMSQTDTSNYKKDDDNRFSNAM